MNLTITPNRSNIHNVLAKSSAEIDTSNSTGVISTPIRKCFFYVRYMVGCLKHLSGWRFPVDRSINFIQSITIQIDTWGDGLKSLLLETIMSKNKSKGLNRPELSQLPFYDADYKPAVFWRVDPCGDYTQECLIGEQYAIAALDFIIETDFSPLLGWIVTDMAEVNNFSGIEIGFMSKISEIAVQQHKYDYTLRVIQETVKEQGA